MLIKYNLSDTQEKHPRVINKTILSSNDNDIPFNLSIIRVLPNASTNSHNHHDSEFLIILSGEGEIQLNDDVHFVSQGDVIYIKPFSNHKIINNHSAQDLVFTTCWWFTSSQLKNIIENDMVKKNLLPENTVIISSFPTPNGPLHLGHLSGPFIAEDIYARLLRQHGKSVFLVCGLDQNQTWCGIQADDAQTHANQIKKTLLNIEFQSDFFIEPKGNNEYMQLTQKIFSELFLSNALISKKSKVFICERTGRYLADCEIIGSCPHCNSAIRGNNCEQCFSFINDVEIVDAKPLNPYVKLGTIEKERYYFPLSRYDKLIKEFVNTSKLNSSLKQICLELLNKQLPDIPVTHYFPWGIPVEPDNITGQYICYYFEQVTRLIYALKQNGVNSSEWSKNTVVRFFGIDNTFMYSLFSPALIYSYKPQLFSQLASNANQYYLLENEKFSTSRRHAIWGDEFIEKWGSDLSRLYLAYSRPEDSHSNFSNGNFMVFCSTLQSEWQSWLFDLFNDIKCHFNNKIPEAGAWDSFQENYFSTLHAAIKEMSNYLLIDNFSTKEYVHAILGIISRVGRFRYKYLSLAGSKEMKTYYRTAIALQASTAYVLAIICWPLMPIFAKKLYNSLGFEGEPIHDWSVLPQLLPSDRTISCPPLLFKEEVLSEAI